MRFIILFLLSSLFFGCSNGLERITQATVSITNFDKTSGGSGSVIGHTTINSVVLTNSHVCELIKKGGLVNTDTASYAITAYKTSKVHDLCLIKVNHDLGTQVKVADYPPARYSEVMSSGHPKLLPTVLTKGEISGNMIVSILVGVKKCTTKDMQDNGLLCILLGGMPQIKTYETTIASTMTQPGSSGSALYDSSQRIVAVVFAGAGDMSFSLTVPYEHVYSFVNFESKKLPFELVSTQDSAVAENDSDSKDRTAFLALIKQYCNLKKFKETAICKALKNSLNLSDLIYRD